MNGMGTLGEMPPLFLVFRERTYNLMLTLYIIFTNQLFFFRFLYLSIMNIYHRLLSSVCDKMNHKKQVSFTMSDDIVEFLDANKGELSRSAYAENLLGGLMDLYTTGEITL